MRRLTLRSLWQHKRRLFSTVLAVLLGVAFMAGSFVFTDTLNHVFDDLFATVNRNADAEVRGKELFEAEFGGSYRQRLDGDLVERVEEVDGVRATAPFIQSFGGRVLEADGDPLGSTQGPPTLFQPWTTDKRLNPYRLTEGRAPRTAREMGLNVAAADDGDFSVGDQVTVITQFGPQPYRLVGVFTFGTADSAAGAVSAVFTLTETQRLAGAENQLESINVAAREGISEAELVRRLRPVLPEGAEAVTATQSAEEQADDIQQGLSFFATILVVFAGIALLTGSFIIYNTFAILVAQRTRELALLRALGASRRQVFGSVLLEAVVIGAVASLLGLATGIGLAAGIQALMRAAGVDLPSAGLVVATRTVVVALTVGLIVTVVAAVAPGWRATRVPPLAALRDVNLDRSGASRVRAVVGAALLGLSVLGLAQAFGDSGSDSLPAVGLGSLCAFLAVIVLGPLIARPAALVLGGFLRRLKGVTGTLARQNAARNPRRTAATAAALMVSVTLIGFISIFAASAKESIEGDVTRGLRADLIVTSGSLDPTTGVSPVLAEELAQIDGVAAVSEFRLGPAQLTLPGGKTLTTFIGSIDPETVDAVLNLSMEKGRLSDLTDEGMVVDRVVAEDEGLGIGDRVEVLVPGGKQLELRVAAISDEPTLLGQWAVTNDAFASVYPELLDNSVFVDVHDEADLELVRTDVERAADAYPTIEVQNLDEYIGSLNDLITSLLTIVYALLGLSIFIAVIGVANTLSLSIHERTRELGLLRAVGMTRRQVRSTVRWEAVIMALLGTTLGLVLSLAVSLGMVRALEGDGLTRFVVPGQTLLVVLIVAGVLGVVAAARPARRAARLDVLAAIATE